jgi:hypothetical protein
MVRARITAQVRYGHFAEYIKVTQQFNEIARARGWSEGTLWVPTVGTGNQAVIEVDYPDLATFEREGDAQASDSEWRDAIRSSIDHLVEGSVRIDLFQTAPQLA